MVKFSQSFSKTRIKGNILAMTLLIAGVASVTAVSVSALVLSDIDVSSQMEDSGLAYQAASAGLDLGMLYERYNKNSQYSSNCNLANGTCTTTPTSTDDPNKTDDNAIRIYLDRLGCQANSTSSTCNGVNINNSVNFGSYSVAAPTNPSINLPSSERVADIKIFYQDDKIGDPAKIDQIGNECSQTNNVAGCNPVIKQDETYQINGLDKDDQVYLYLRPYTNATGTATWAQELDTFRKQNGRDPMPDQAKDYGWFQNFCKQSKVMSNIKGVSGSSTTDLCGVYTFSIPYSNANNWVHGIRSMIEKPNFQKHMIGTHDNTLKIRPMNMDATLAAEVKDINGTPKNIDSGISRIQSTGYYGQAKRTLEMQIDRNSNSIIGVFDRALYVGEGDLTY